MNGYDTSKEKNGKSHAVDKLIYIIMFLTINVHVLAKHSILCTINVRNFGSQ